MIDRDISSFNIVYFMLSSVFAVYVRIENFASLNGDRGGVFNILAPRSLNDFAHGEGITNRLVQNAMRNQAFNSSWFE